jgi:hypothetical protein
MKSHELNNEYISLVLADDCEMTLEAEGRDDARLYIFNDGAGIGLVLIANGGAVWEHDTNERLWADVLKHNGIEF